MNLKINIKKLSPTLSIGAAAATAIPSIILQCQNSRPPIVVNNFVKGKPIDKSEGVAKKINMEELPTLNLNSQKPLGKAWEQYLLHSDQHDLWVENERKLLESYNRSHSSARPIKSRLFKNAKKRIKENKKVTGTIIYNVCKKAYQRKRLYGRQAKRLIKDVWNYCNVANQARKK